MNIPNIASIPNKSLDIFGYFSRIVVVSKLVFPEEQDAVGQRQEFEDCDGHSEGSTHPLDEEGFGVDLKLDFLDSLYV